MKRSHMITAIAVPLAAATFYLSQRPAATDTALPPAPGAPLVQVTVPDTLSAQAKLGKTAFEAVCAACHGDKADGRSEMGPPLIHKIYEPSHHGDAAFFRAAALGVRAHHWPFGDMPPQSHLTRAEVQSIITYLRAVQRANGIH